ncbi:MAG: hypothetical protein H0X26_06460 [Alphaproteobacteria bacterium]|nr:hypothetical protein [Alphaproteobacteria bacterium]
MKSNFYLIAIYISFFCASAAYGENYKCPDIKKWPQDLHDGWTVYEGDKKKTINPLTFIGTSISENRGECNYGTEHGEILIRLQNPDIYSIPGKRLYTFETIEDQDGKIVCLGNIQKCEFKEEFLKPTTPTEKTIQPAPSAITKKAEEEAEEAAEKVAREVAHWAAVEAAQKAAAEKAAAEAAQRAAQPPAARPSH